MTRVAPALLAAATLVLAGCGGGVDEAEKQVAIGAAEAAYAKAKAEGEDFSSGPCIADPLPGLADWVADVAHDPRRDVDDKAENQCSAYRDGRAHHFVELDPGGEVIRAE